MKRLFTIRLSKVTLIKEHSTEVIWVWSDWGGWGTSVSPSFWKTLWAAIKGE